MTIKVESDLRKKFEEEQKKIEEKLRKIKNRIAVYSGKGGVGKSTVAVGVAAYLREYGTVGLMDADITAPNVHKMLGVEGPLFADEDQEILPREKKGIKIVSLGMLLPHGQPVIWRGPLKTTAIRQFVKDVKWGELDYLVIDLPPGTGDETLTVMQELKPNVALVVTTPQEVAIMDARRTINMAKTMGIKKIYVIENMSYLKCPNCGTEIDLYGRGRAKEMAEKEEVQFLGEVPMDPEIVKRADKGELLEYFEESELGKIFKEIVKKMVKL